MHEEVGTFLAQSPILEAVDERLIYLFNLLKQTSALGWKMCSECDQNKFECCSKRAIRKSDKSSRSLHFQPTSSFPPSLSPSQSLSCSGTERGADGPSVIQRGMFHVHLAQAQIPPAGKLFSGQPPVIRGWSLLHSTTWLPFSLPPYYHSVSFWHQYLSHYEKICLFLATGRWGSLVSSCAKTMQYFHIFVLSGT